MATTFTKETKPTTTFDKVFGNDFLLKQDAFYLLLQNGSKIILSSGSLTTSYTKEVKS